MPPASESEVAGVEATLGRELQPPFRRVLLELARSAWYEWRR